MIPCSRGEGIVPHADDRDHSFAESISKSMEMSYLLKSRSPWISVETHGGPAIIEQRERSISHASMPSMLDIPGGGMSPLSRVGGGQSPLSRRSLPIIRAVDDGYLDSHFDDNQWLLKDNGDSQQSVLSLRSQSSVKGYVEEPQLSTLSQSVFNATNLLMGVGLLRHVLFNPFLSNHTAV
jgi:hypothetical protein